MRYFLPNKQEIDLEALEQAMLAEDDVRRFLDTETGKVVAVAKDGASTDGPGLTYEYTPARFAEISKIAIADRINSMREFAKTIVSYESPALSKKLRAIIKTGGEGATQAFVSALEQDQDGWIHGWAQWEGDMVFEEMEGWLASLPIDIAEDPELDMDCSCCRGLASSLLTGHGESEFQLIQKTHREARGRNNSTVT